MIRELLSSRMFRPAARQRVPSRFERILAGRRLRMLVRGLAASFLMTTLLYGLIQGGHLSDHPLYRLIDRTAVTLGFAAEHIRISGLKTQTPETVLSILGIAPGASLMDFDAAQAEKRLAQVDWVARAQVRRIFPNQLEIEITERVPFAIWQRGGQYFLIDRTGAVIGFDPKPYAGKLLLVSGEGAQLAVEALVNHLESNPGLKSRLVAASRVGGRRWNLYFPQGVKVLLPETGEAEALAELERLEQGRGILEKAVSLIDLRLADRMVITPLPQPAAEAGEVEKQPQ